MLHDQLKKFNIILASGSPRRQKFFQDLNIEYEIKTIPVDETYSEELKGSQITDFLSLKKAEPFEGTLQKNDILITSDTIVWHDGKALGKPQNREDAFQVLKSLSGKTHEVITSVCFTTVEEQQVLNDTTKVTFKELCDGEINFYLDMYKPYDKAGAYGIQEWIGFIGVTFIQGSYNTVIGFPTHLVYNALQKIALR